MKSDSAPENNGSGNEKATVKIRREVDYALRRLSGTVIQKGDFLYPADNREIVVKMPNRRKSQHISPDEFAVAMVRILRTYVGANEKTLCSETARVYGFRSLGKTISVSLSKAVEILKSREIIEEIDGKLVIKE